MFQHCSKDKEIDIIDNNLCPLGTYILFGGERQEIKDIKRVC